MHTLYLLQHAPPPPPLPHPHLTKTENKVKFNAVCTENVHLDVHLDARLVLSKIFNQRRLMAKPVE